MSEPALLLLKNRLDLAALGLIVVGVGLRLLLLKQHWPWTDSDEGIFGLMARHIAYQGERPTFMYGSYYMGPLQAYLGAALFHVFGSSLLALRLGLVMLFALFLAALYLLTRTLYTRGLGLFTLALLSLGSPYMLTYQLRSYGGYPEILLCGTLALLIATWLALSAGSAPSWRRRLVRAGGYLSWGIVVGLGLWSDMLILPLMGVSGLLILLFCWRELLRVAPVICMLGGLILGMWPLLAYNLHPLPGHDTLTAVAIQREGPVPLHYTPALVWQQIKATIQLSLPTISGNPFCPVSEVPVLRDPTSPPTLTCRLIHSGWGGGYLLLFLCALGLAAWDLWRLGRSRLAGKPVEQVALARSSARLLLLLAAAATLVLFIHSLAPLKWPSLHGRYLIIFWIALPATLWPLWKGARMVWSSRLRFQQLGRSLCLALLLLLLLFYGLGTAQAFSQSPTAQTYYQQDMAFVQHLEQLGVSHFYSDYWTCYKLAFLSQERLTCGVVNQQLQPGYIRYWPYYWATQADHHAAYVLSRSDYAAALKQLMTQQQKHYRFTLYGDYYIVQPL
ncbi:ArnT family glycosyltransferase [Thermogemmatispora sp.]|uniref:ArnT family glycosyltransferase n=1 Tax=Thermogemmatispora sp. TaxID=1968838 RepID=UPI0035E40869